jgi:hypothetical protein
MNNKFSAALIAWLHFISTALKAALPTRGRRVATPPPNEWGLGEYGVSEANGGRDA